MEENKLNIVTVRWLDGHMEVFKATEVSLGSDFLWMCLLNGSNRSIPFSKVSEWRWKKSKK